MLQGPAKRRRGRVNTASGTLGFRENEDLIHAKRETRCPAGGFGNRVFSTRSGGPGACRVSTGRSRGHAHHSIRGHTHRKL